jgi:zona occludens toxin (predicted ATPase)
MLWTIAVILVVLWLLVMVSSYTLGGFILFGERSDAGVEPNQCTPGNASAIVLGQISFSIARAISRRSAPSPSAAAAFEPRIAARPRRVPLGPGLRGYLLPHLTPARSPAGAQLADSYPAPDGPRH